MKKMALILAALLVVAVSVFFTAAAAGEKEFISPTAPTITIPPETVVPPTVPGVIPTVPGGGYVAPPAGGGTTGSPKPGGTTSVVGGTKAPAATSARPTLGLGTTPDGSTVTGTAKPDVNPESPKTGGMSTEAFAFAATVIAFAGTAVVLKKRKAADAC